MKTQKQGLIDDLGRIKDMTTGKYILDIEKINLMLDEILEVLRE